MAGDVNGVSNRELRLPKLESLKRFRMIAVFVLPKRLPNAPLVNPVPGLFSKMALYFLYSSWRKASTNALRLKGGIL